MNTGISIETAADAHNDGMWAAGARHILFVLLLVALCSLGIARNADAATFTVTKTADTNDGACNADCSLREAIRAANAAAGADTIVVPAGNYFLTLGPAGDNVANTGDLDITSNITINGAGAATTIIDGRGAFRVFEVRAGGSATIGDVTMTNGLSNAGFSGGALNVQNGGASARINRSIISNNVGTGSAAGGIGNSGAGTLSITNSTINNNTNARGPANAGGAVGAGIDNNGGTVTITNSTISGNGDANPATDQGPGYFSFAGTSTISFTTFSANVDNANNGYGYDAIGATNTAVRNTIVDDGCAAAVNTDNGYNIDIANGCGFGAGTSQINTNAVTTPLANNGGPTPAQVTPTHAIGITSAAYNAIPNGVNGCVGGTTTDQRTAIRAGGLPETGSTACDIGAYEFITVPVPVTLSHFNATGAGGTVSFEWSTATEIGNVGFYLYEKTREGVRRINDELIVSKVIDSTTPQHYEHTAYGITGERFYIEDVDIRGRVERHGPFELGKPYGAKPESQAIDWKSIRAERRAKMSARKLARKAARRSVGTAQHFVLDASIDSMRSRGSSDINLLVDRDGIYRVTNQDLLDFGVDPSDMRGENIRLTNQGDSVPVYASTKGAFDVDSYFEFYGQSMDTLYTRTNVYTLTLGGRNSRFVGEANGRVPKRDPAAFYMQTRTVENNNAYSFLAPNGDPWFDTQLLALSGPVTRDFTIEVDHLVAGATPRLSVDLWGVTSWPEDPDHHVQIAVNGIPVADERFDGLTSHYVGVDLEPGVLHEGSNTLSLTLAHDLEVRWDIVMLNSYGITYPRAFTARDGELIFTAAGKVFQVNGLATGNAVVYRLTSGGIKRIQRLKSRIEDDGTYSIRFRGAKKLATYLVYDEGALLKPTLEPAPEPADIRGGSADYLMIAHPQFIDGLAPLVQFHEGNGLRVKLVDVEDVYAGFGHGVVDPHAIQDYIAHAHANMGIKYVLLVGGDSYDYHDYLGIGSVSFIPSLYTETEPFVSFAPVDPLYTDVDSDGLPNLPIGRLPVRNVLELDNIVTKTLAYADKDYRETALLAADAADGGASFSAISDRFIERLAPEWQVQRAYIDTLGVPEATQRIKDTINDGVALTSFFGHSGPNTWTFAGLFNADDAAALSNGGRPTIVTQWGCWNTYHVEPAYNTLAHQFLLNDAGGAAAVLGASTITLSASEEALGERVMPRIVHPATTIGEAIQDAKRDLAASQPELNDVLLGWTLLGDPALEIVPEGGPLPVEPQPEPPPTVRPQPNPRPSPRTTRPGAIRRP